MSKRNKRRGQPVRPAQEPPVDHGPEQPAAKLPESLPPGTWKVTRGSFEETTLAEHGRKSVFGQVDEFAFEPRSIANQAKIGQFVEADPSLEGKVGEVFARRIACALSRLGSEDLAEKSPHQRMPYVQMLRLGDIMYMSLFRLAEGDNGLLSVNMPEGAQCPDCGGPIKGKITVDLKKIHVRVSDALPRVRYRMQKPWNMGGVDVDIVELEPATIGRWQAGLNAEAWQSESLQTIRRVITSMAAVNGKPVQYEPRHVLGSNLMWDDVKGMDGALDAIGCGPAPAVPWQHKCGAEIPIPVSWESGFF